MKKFINWLTKLLGLEADRARLAQLERQASSARNQLIAVTRRLEQAEAQAAGHVQRISRVEKQSLPVRYVADTVTGGLSETR